MKKLIVLFLILIPFIGLSQVRVYERASSSGSQVYLISETYTQTEVDSIKQFVVDSLAPNYDEQATNRALTADDINGKIRVSDSLTLSFDATFMGTAKPGDFVTIYAVTDTVVITIDPDAGYQVDAAGDSNGVEYTIPPRGVINAIKRDADELEVIR